jgi:ketosteroid isomerase-like protein
MSSSEDNVDLARRMLTTPLSADLLPAMAEAMLEEGVRLRYPGASPIPFAKVWEGRRGFLEFMNLFYSSVEVQSMQTLDFAGCGDEVFIRGTTTARVIATGKAYSSDWLLIWKFRSGKVADMWEYHDTQAMAEAFTPSMPPRRRRSPPAG